MRIGTHFIVFTLHPLSIYLFNPLEGILSSDVQHRAPYGQDFTHSSDESKKIKIQELNRLNSPMFAEVMNRDSSSYFVYINSIYILLIAVHIAIYTIPS